MRLLRPDADHLPVLEALYAPEPDWTRWTSDVVDATRTLVPDLAGRAFIIVEHEHGYRNQSLAVGFSTFDRADALQTVSLLPPALFRAMFYPGVPACTQSEISAALPTPSATALLEFRQMAGIIDAVGVIGNPEPGVAAVISFQLDHEYQLAPTERKLLSQLAGHMDSAVRLRSRPDAAVAAVLTPSGRFLDLADGSLTGLRQDWFAARVTAIESSRRGRARAPDDRNAWWALFDGRYSIVPREDRDNKRYYLLVENTPSLESHARFTGREIDVVRLASRGFTSKSIAYNLGISSSAVSVALKTAAAKLGLRSRHDLLQVAAAMFGASADAVDHQELSAAELEILSLLQRGLSNAEIASRRGRSANTIKNQIAGMLRKTGSASRRALAVAGKRDSSSTRTALK